MHSRALNKPGSQETGHKDTGTGLARWWHKLNLIKSHQSQKQRRAKRGNALINICHSGYKADFAETDFAHRRVNWIVHWPDSEKQECQLGGEWMGKMGVLVVGWVGVGRRVAGW